MIMCLVYDRRYDGARRDAPAAPDGNAKARSRAYFRLRGFLWSPYPHIYNTTAPCHMLHRPGHCLTRRDDPLKLNPLPHASGNLRDPHGPWCVVPSTRASMPLAPRRPSSPSLSSPHRTQPPATTHTDTRTHTHARPSPHLAFQQAHCIILSVKTCKGGSAGGSGASATSAGKQSASSRQAVGKQSASRRIMRAAEQGERGGKEECAATREQQRGSSAWHGGRCLRSLFRN